MDKAHLDRIIAFLRADSGLSFAGPRQPVLRSHLETRIARLGMSDPGSYLALLAGSAAERHELYDLITVNETSFFRNRQQFEDLKGAIIPRLEKERGLSQRAGKGEGHPSRRLRILSAGCSTGEEPFSLAMTLLEAVRYPSTWNLEIVAGDLSEGCLRTAARGYYPEARLKGIPPAYRERYLRREGDGWYVREEVKRLVRFVPLNLARVAEGEGRPGMGADCTGFDVIFCRNVLIYFPLDTQQLLIDSLQRLLAPGGYLFTGDAEPLHLYRHRLETVRQVASLIYRKAGAPESAQVCGPGSAPLPQSPSAAAPAAGPEREPLSRPGIEELLLAVSDPSLSLRGQALEKLLLQDLDQLFPALEAAVRNDRVADLRNGAMELLVRFGEAAVPKLVTLLNDPDEEVRNFSSVMLGNIGSSRGVPALIAALKDPDPNVRHGAAEALGKIGDPLAAEPLLALLDQGFWLQFPAIAALGELGSSVALPRLLRLLDDEVLFEPVVRALQKIGDPLALPRLSAVARGSDPRRARVASQALSVIEQVSIGGRRSLPVSVGGQ